MQGLNSAMHGSRHSAELLYDFLIALFTDPATPQKLAGLDTFKNSVSGTDWQHLLSYAAQVRSCLHRVPGLLLMAKAWVCTVHEQLSKLQNFR